MLATLDMIVAGLVFIIASMLTPEATGSIDLSRCWEDKYQVVMCPEDVLDVYHFRHPQKEERP